MTVTRLCFRKASQPSNPAHPGVRRHFNFSLATNAGRAFQRRKTSCFRAKILAPFSKQPATRAKLVQRNQITQTGYHCKPFATYLGYLLRAATMRSCIAVSYSTLPVDFRLRSEVISTLNAAHQPCGFAQQTTRLGVQASQSAKDH